MLGEIKKTKIIMADQGTLVKIVKVTLTLPTGQLTRPNVAQVRVRRRAV